MANQQYTYTAPGNYTYDSDRVEVSSGLAKLKAVPLWSGLIAYWQMNEATQDGIRGTYNPSSLINEDNF